MSLCEKPFTFLLPDNITKSHPRILVFSEFVHNGVRMVGVEVEVLSNPLSNGERFNEISNYLKLCFDSWSSGMVSYYY